MLAVLSMQVYQQRTEYVQDIKRHLLRCRGHQDEEEEEDGSEVTSKELRQTLRQVT